MNRRGGSRSSRAATRRDDQAVLEVRQRGQRAQPLRTRCPGAARTDRRAGSRGPAGPAVSGRRPAKNASSASSRSASRPLVGTTTSGRRDRLPPRQGPGEAAAIELAPARRAPGAVGSCNSIVVACSRRLPKAEQPVPGEPGGVRQRRIPVPESAASLAGWTCYLTMTACRTRSFSKYTANWG